MHLHEVIVHILAEKVSNSYSSTVPLKRIRARWDDDRVLRSSIYVRLYPLLGTLKVSAG